MLFQVAQSYQKNFDKFLSEPQLKITPATFYRQLRYFETKNDWKKEGYSSHHQQRLETITWRWGHNYNFGEFKVKDYMAFRHLVMASIFIDYFGLPSDLTGLKLLDIGAFIGASSFVYNMMGAHVVACEEVRKYSQVTDFLISSYGMKNIETAPYSLYDLPPEFNNQFDIVHYAGVLYHVSDPLLSLRLLYNALKPGGIILIETNACCLDLDKSFEPSRNLPYITYEGNTWRWGNNWFNPSPVALRNMMLDMGFENVQVTGSNVANIRMYAVGQKVKYKEFLRAGFARTDIC